MKQIGAGIRKLGKLVSHGNIVAKMICWLPDKKILGKLVGPNIFSRWPKKYVFWPSKCFPGKLGGQRKSVGRGKRLGQQAILVILLS